MARRNRGPRLRATAVLFLATALAWGCGYQAPTQTPSPHPQDVSPEPSTGAQASPGITPLPTEEPVGWTRLSPAALVRVATLEATRAGAAAVAPNTSFRLTSLTGAPARQLAGRLVATPPLKLEVARATATEAVLRPAAPLRHGQVYRFELRREDGTVQAAWAVQAAWPLRVAATVPDDAATAVPRDTGIEITFDQPGVKRADLQSHFTIKPAVDGRFERHGRTWVFVPATPLRRSTLYTVTIRHGLPLPGTGMRLEQDAVIRFETTGARVSRVHVTTARAIFDASPRERAVIGLRFDYPENEARVKSVDVTVHRLDGLTAAIAAYRQVVAAPDWTERSSTAPVKTASLPRVVNASLRVRLFDDDDWRGYVMLPERLPSGWYIVTVTHAGIARQTVLQVTELSAFTVISSTRSLVWVNNLRTDAPVAGASISLAGQSFGTTDARGLRVARSTASLIESASEGQAAVAVVRSGARTVFVPLASSEQCLGCGQDDSDPWWHLLTTDRLRYRVTDTVNVWGVMRNRDSGAPPDSVAVRMTTTYEDGPATSVVASANATPDQSGAYVARLSFTNLPPGEYPVSVRVGGKQIADLWVSVGPIAKPAWKMDLATPHRAVLAGASVPVDVSASFYEGTPVAGAALRLTSSSEDEDGESGAPSEAVTDVSGNASGSVTVGLGNESESQWSVVSVWANAAEPEEGDITAELPVAVFRSTALLSTESTLSGTKLTITGAVNDVVFERFDNPDTALWDVDPVGDPRPGAAVRVHVTEHIQILRQVGTRYDFIAKRTVPVYHETERTRDLGNRTVTTAENGTFRLSMTVKGGDRSYEILASYVDEAGRRIESTASAWQASAASTDRAPWVSTTRTDDGWGEYSVGDTVKVRFRGGIASPEVDRYLFAVEARGLRSVSVQDRSTYTFKFTKGLVPEAGVTAVRFTGTGYEVALDHFSAQLRLDDRRLDVTLTTDQERYAPGGRATIEVLVKDARGRPAAASVFVRAVDEKLFDIGGAATDDTLGTLYQVPWSGLVAAAWSHASPDTYEGDGKGDTTGGGGDRGDFRDWLVARIVTTGADGRASVSFDLSDDLTSWRVLASAVTPAIEAGDATASIPVSLPFFADVIVAPEYLTVDRPIIRARAYGTALAEGDDVTFTVSSPSLPMAAITVEGKAFQPVEIELPALSVGDHQVRVAATTGSGDTRREDSLVRAFRVVDSRTVRRHVESAALVAGTTVGGGDGLTTVTLVDAGRGRVVPDLRDLASGEPFRADSAIAAAIARDLLAKEYGIPDDPGLPEVDLSAFQNDQGIAVVPYASASLELSAMAALSGDPRLNLNQLRQYFQDQEPGQPTDRSMFLLLGMAATGDASLGDVTAAAARTDLAPTDKVTVALAALAVGDLELAGQIERDLLAAHGERLGSWVRLNVGTREENAVATGRLAIVAAAVGDPLAIDMDAEITAHPPSDTLLDLERAIAATWWAKRTPTATAVAAITLDGKRTEVTIAADQPAMLAITPAQRAGFRIDPVSGSVLVMSEWDGAVEPGDLTTPDGLSVTRTVAPAGAIGATDTVAVTFRVTLGPNDAGCWQLTDFAPSGLAPVSTPGGWERDTEDETTPASYEPPWRVVGQRVDFCVARDPQRPIHTLRYLARVVTPGTYRWESAVLQSSLVPEQGIVLPAFDVTIEGLGS